MAKNAPGGLIATVVILAVISVALVGASALSSSTVCVPSNAPAPPKMAAAAPSVQDVQNVQYAAQSNHSAASNMSGAAQSGSCSPGPEPASFYPYGENEGAAYDASYPNAEDMSSKYPRGCGSATSADGYQLNVDSLMPASWRGGAQSCGDQSEAGSQWAKYAPTKESFDRYITAAGSARLSLNTRSPLGRQTGTPLLLRQGPAVPISAQEYPWNDSGFRQDLVFNQTGRYPTSTAC